MTRIRWTSEAVDRIESLLHDEQLSLLQHLELVAEFPAMDPARQRGRFLGLRYFMVKKGWLVYYRILPEEAVLVFDIVPARMQLG